ncbi:hypothetical protein HAX54_049092 [Datura stramonium]|uniref:Uncharacterized protein n=1 Tax=Datura stramonium TaxID=4076 RepID=A0ABS8WM75_DATST|nr:hypothetical protein [Datura stramonium]
MVEEKHESWNSSSLNKKAESISSRINRLHNAQGEGMRLTCEVRGEKEKGVVSPVLWVWVFPVLRGEEVEREVNVAGRGLTAMVSPVVEETAAMPFPGGGRKAAGRGGAGCMWAEKMGRRERVRESGAREEEERDPAALRRCCCLRRKEGGEATGGYWWFWVLLVVFWRVWDGREGGRLPALMEVGGRRRGERERGRSAAAAIVRGERWRKMRKCLGFGGGMKNK